MSKPGSERLETHTVYSHQLSDGPRIEVDYVYLLNYVRNGKVAEDPGGVQFTLSGEDGPHIAVVEPEVALEIADGIRDAANIAIAAREHGAAPDGVPAEWTGEGPV